MKKKAYLPIVDTHNRKYSYDDMEADIRVLRQSYPEFLHVKSIGTTSENREIYCFCLGNTKAEKKLLVNAAIHGREWLNSQMFMAMTEEYCRGYTTAEYKGIRYHELFDKVSLFILPMLNPDGVCMSQQELPRWKANAAGVDLNRNFEPGFGRNGITEPGSEEYSGSSPLSEKETEALVKMVQEVNPCGVINYHETGRLIYYTRPSGLLNAVASVTKYRTKQEAQGAYGSFGDWLDQENTMYCTVETCRGKAPVSHWQYYLTYKENKNVWLAAANYFY